MPAVQAEPSKASAVSWGAIVAGAAAAAALSLILLILGTGLGLSAVSPWASVGVGAVSFGVSTILWITFTQLLASGMGGYLAGRLRTRWADTAADEVYFRDTAHGFLAWAVASLATAALLTSVIGAIVGGGVQAGAALAGGGSATAAVATAGGAAAAGHGAVRPAGDSTGMGYFVDALFRGDSTAANAGAANAGAPLASTSAAGAAAVPGEVARIFTSALAAGSLPPDDARHVASLVSQRTGLSPQEADKRVADTFTRMQTQLRDAQASAKEAADKARKASAFGALWLFISLLSGAFVASLAATCGGRRRDA